MRIAKELALLILACVLGGAVYAAMQPPAVAFGVGLFVFALVPWFAAQFGG